MNTRQLGGLDSAKQLITIAAGNAKQIRTIIAEVRAAEEQGQLTPEYLRAQGTKIELVAGAVDGWEQSAISWIDASIRDRNYPLEPVPGK